MHMLGIEPSSVILAKQSIVKIEIKTRDLTTRWKIMSDNDPFVLQCFEGMARITEYSIDLLKPLTKENSISLFIYNIHTAVK